MLEKFVAELRERFDRMEAQTKALHSEFAHRRRLGLGTIPWDDHATFTVAAGEKKDFDLMRERGRIAVQLFIEDAGTGGAMGINGGEPFAVGNGDRFVECRAGRLRIDNSNGTGSIKVVCFLAVSKATGGPW